VPRLFVAVWPPADIVEQVAALARPQIEGLRWTRPDQWHVTLRFLGRVDEASAADVSAALSSVGVSSVGGPSLEATIGPAVGRFGRRVLHVPVQGLGPLATAVVDATAGFGEPPEDRPFAGHLTLARVGRGARDDLRPLAGASIGGRWLVDELTLVESRLSPAGARYEVVERFSLGAAPA
jgi:2'-5' RNA ligase